MAKQSRAQMEYEIKMQLGMLKRLERWKRLAAALSGIGMVLAWYGFKNGGAYVITGGLGILFSLLCLAAAVILLRGIRNGKRNVEKIIHIVKG